MGTVIKLLSGMLIANFMAVVAFIVARRICDTRFHEF